MQSRLQQPAETCKNGTGGTGSVIGSGNVPVFIDETADIPFAVKNIISSKTFDNGTICASEQVIVVMKTIEKQVREEFEKQHCYFFNHLAPSLTLGCGTGGKNITTENITAKNLINIQRVSRRKPNELWFSYDHAKYNDESLHADEIMKEYYKNH